MPRKPLAIGLVLAVASLVTVSCSQGGSESPTPGNQTGDKSTSTSTTTKAKAPDTKLKKLTGKDDIKNVIVKTATGKVSLAAKSPGHEVIEQIYDSTAKTWSEPTTVFKDDTRFCHAIKAKSVNGTIAATVRCSISAQDVNGTQSSYVLGSTDGKTWKRSDLVGGGEKAIFSSSGNFVAWPSPKSFLLWNPKLGTFKSVPYAQSESEPAVGVIQNNGVLLILKAVQGKKHSCTISFQTASAAAPTPKALNTTAPLEDRPKCMASSAHFQGTELIANFTMTTTTKDDKGKKVEKTDVFSVAFTRAASGSWIIKAA
jgi:hypothetical protein